MDDASFRFSLAASSHEMCRISTWHDPIFGAAHADAIRRCRPLKNMIRMRITPVQQRARAMPTTTSPPVRHAPLV